METSIYFTLVNEIGRIFTGAPTWVYDYVIPILSIGIILFLFLWVIGLIFAFVKNLIRGK